MRTAALALCAALLSPAFSWAQEPGSDLAALPVEHGIAVPAVDLDGPLDLDLRGWRTTFEDTFRRPDVTPDKGPGRWFAPVHAPFGTARFLPPGPGGPFQFGPGGVTLRASKGPDGKWVSATMQTVNSSGRGFAQQYGYFEMRARMPSGYATWPAFWLLSQNAWPAFWLLSQNGYTDHSRTRAELDVVEGYGGEPDRMHSTIHLWPQKRPDGSLTFPKHWFASARLKVRGMQTGVHAYGVLVGPEKMTFFYDRHALFTRPTLPEFRTPLYMLVTLAVNDKQLAAMPSPQDLQVESVRTYAQR